MVFTGEKRDEEHAITIMGETGNVLQEITSKCFGHCGKHSLYRHIIEHPVDSNYIVESCVVCRTIRSYNINSGGGNIIYDKCTPLTLELFHNLKTDVKVDDYAAFNKMCYVKQQYICVFISYHHSSITAVRFHPLEGSW